MLKFIKKRVLTSLYNYYHNKASYCYGKVDEYSPAYNDYWGAKTMKYTAKEFKMFEKLVQMGEI